MALSAARRAAFTARVIVVVVVSCRHDGKLSPIPLLTFTLYCRQLRSDAADKFYGAAAASLVLAWVVQLHAGGMVRFVRGVIANPLSLNGEATSDPIFHPISFPPSPSHNQKIMYVGTMNIMDNNSHKYKQLRSESIKNSYHR
eukprot:scaffold2449_cov129-Skeletonema_marinoi.AAC.4